MDRKQLAAAVSAELERLYPDAICALDYIKPHELLISVRLSAQCTDARVNQITPALFERYSSLEDFAAADPADIEKIIYSCGFYRTKAADIVAACRILLAEHGGVIPEDIDTLIKLPGVGRKTANLLVGDLYGKPSVVCDTHCIRISNRLGLADSKDPHRCEIQLREVLDPATSGDFCHRIVWFGRDICTARSPACGRCPLSEICPGNVAGAAPGKRSKKIPASG